MPLIDLSDVRLLYEIHGHGPAVLLVPGLGQNLRAYDPIVPQLAKAYSVIQVDNRGIGESIAHRPARHMEDYASDYVELLDRLQVDRTHLVGLSFGGVIAQRLAADHASRINRLVLISTTDRSSPYLKHVGVLLGHALRHFPLALFFQTIELLATSPEHFDKNVEQIMQSIPLRSGGRGTRRGAGQPDALPESGGEFSQARDITAPTLALAGEYDALIPNCYGRQLAAALDNGRFAIIKGSGHNPIFEQPDAAVKFIEQFLSLTDEPKENVSKEQDEPRNRPRAA